MAGWSISSKIVSRTAAYSSFYNIAEVTDRIKNSLLEKIISSFIVISGTKHIFAGIDSTAFKITLASRYYTERTGYRRKYAKLSIGADVLKQIICTIKIDELLQDMII